MIKRTSKKMSIGICMKPANLPVLRLLPCPLTIPPAFAWLPRARFAGGGVVL